MGKYSAVHTNPAGAGDARPTALQIVQDNELEGKLIDKVIVITGVTSGIGAETARALFATGATLLLTARDVEAAKVALSDIVQSDHVFLKYMDNTSFASVRATADDILKQCKNQVNVLVCNAGIMGITTRTLTEDDHEVHFQVNHLGHFLLFELLKPALLASTSPEFSSRCVMVSSSAHRATRLRETGDYSFEKGEYSFGDAYANSKLANIYAANEIERRYGSKGLHATSLHPGGIMTNISRNLGPEFVAQLMTNPSLVQVLKSPEQGAATTVCAAIGKDWEGKGGKYLEDCEEAKRGEDDNQMLGVGWVKQTYDPVQEARLWKDSLKMVGLQDDE